MVGRIRLAAWALLVLAAPAAGQPLLTITAEPAEGPAPLETTFFLEADPPTQAPWSLFFLHDGRRVELANGTSLPAEAQASIEDVGVHLVRLVVDDNATQLQTTVQVTVLEPLAVARAPLPVISGDVVPLLAAGAIMLALAGWLLRHDHRNPINIGFAVLFIARGVADVTLALWTSSGSLHVRPGGTLDAATGGLAHHLHPVTSIAVMAGAFYFLYVYLAQNRARLAVLHGRVSAALGFGAAAVVLAYLAFPGLWWAPNGLPGGPLFIITGLYYPLYAVFALLLFRESVTDIPDERRRGAFLSGLGFLFLPVFSGAADLIFVDILDFFGRTASVNGFDRSDLSLGFEIGHFAAVLALVPAAAAGAVLGLDAIRRPDRPGARTHFALYLMAVLLPLLSLAAAMAAFMGGTVEAAIDAFHLVAIFQGVWAIPYAVLVAIGITRYQDAGRQETMRRQLRRFTLASIFVSVFFAVSEGVEALAANSSTQYETWAGLGAAAAMTLLLQPIQQRLQRGLLAEPGETVQELRFYREQVRRTLVDGTIGDIERRFLDNLQETMGLGRETAARIEQDVGREMRLAPASA